jgi:hypothetical protein
MVQETSISGQVLKIISEKGTELLRVSSIPENLWPEAIQHAVWLKNRTPARALRKKEAKTPYEALKGDKPTLSRERIWGSRAYVTYPPEFRASAKMTKLHSPRGWLGYFVGYKSEAMYHIYSPKKHKVYQIGVARVEDREGLDDHHDAPCLEDRVPTPDVETSDCPSLEDEEGISDDEDNDTSFHDPLRDSEFLADLETARLTNNTRTHAERGSQRVHELNTETAPQSEVEEEDDIEGEDDSEDRETRPAITSKYFAQSRHAGMAKRKNANDTMLAPKRSR